MTAPALFCSTLASVLLRPGVFSCDPCSLEGTRLVESCFCQAGPVWAEGGNWLGSECKDFLGKELPGDLLFSIKS